MGYLPPRGPAVTPSVASLAFTLGVMNTQDQLTGLDTYDSFLQALCSSAPSAEIVLFDIDYLRLFMHEYGIDAADCLVKAIAQSVAQTAAAMGIMAYRIYGDEFAVLASAGKGLEFARHAQIAVANIQSPVPPQHPSLAHAASVSALTCRIGMRSKASLPEAIDWLRNEMERHKSEFGRGKPPAVVSLPA